MNRLSCNYQRTEVVTINDMLFVNDTEDKMLKMSQKELEQYFKYELTWNNENKDLRNATVQSLVVVRDPMIIRISAVLTIHVSGQYEINLKDVENK